MRSSHLHIAKGPYVAKVLIPMAREGRRLARSCSVRTNLHEFSGGGGGFLSDLGRVKEDKVRQANGAATNLCLRDRQNGARKAGKLGDGLVERRQGQRGHKRLRARKRDGRGGAGEVAPPRHRAN